MAQLVSRKQLLELVKADGRVEESEKAFSYDEFCKYHAECIEDGKRLDFRGQLDDGEDKYLFAYDKVKDTYLESKCPPIKFAGQGSSRAAFALAGGKCVKIATNAKGVAQNKQELKNTADSELMCFTKVYSWDKKTSASLLTECCAQVKESDFQKLLGIQLHQIEQLLSLTVDSRGVDAALKHLNDDYDEMHSAGDEHIDFDLMGEMQRTQAMMKLLKGIKARKTPQMAVLADLIEFYKKNDWNAEALLIGDLSNAGNWGLIARDGQLCLVILDAGFSKTVAKQFY